MSGKEKVYLNNKLVSEQRSVKMQGFHNFKDEAGQHYEVKFKVESLMKGPLECTKKREDTVLKVFKMRLISPKNFTPKRILILMLASAIFGVVKAIYNLPDFTVVLFLLLILLIHVVTRDYGEMIIEE